MKTKIVYVLVSTDKDFYLEQAYVSMYSAKYHMPDAHIALLVDRLTDESFVGKRKEMLKYVDELVVVDLDKSLSGKKRSRLLKTCFRQHISGDLLFIDCDTIISKPLYEIDDHKNDIELCRDLHTSLRMNPVRNSIIQRDMKLLQYKYGNDEPYYNSGVMYVKDNERTRKFFLAWYANYMQGYERGVSMDQPSLAITNLEQNYIIRPLSDSWNCQLKHGIKYLGKAKIVHYLGTRKSEKDEYQFFILCNSSEMKSVKKYGEITDTIKSIVLNPFDGIPENTMIISGNEIDYRQTSLCSLFYHIYLSFPKLFLSLDSSIKITFSIS